MHTTKRQQNKWKDPISRTKRQPEELQNEKSFKDLKQNSFDEINKYLEKILFQREQMGPVNLRARIEEKEIESTIDEIELEKNDTTWL